MEPDREKIGHYRILAELGQDELGFFLGAVDERLDRTVVLRVSRPADELGEAADAVWARMRECARIASHLTHPNLVTVYEYLPLQDTDLVALEKVEGDTLEQLHLRGERWTVLDIARIIARLADALAAAHEAGLAHGRVTASNVKIRPDGRIKLLDLGIPREIDEDGNVVVADPAEDVRALAGLACALLAAPGSDALGWSALLEDPTRARASFGFLTPVLARALTVPGESGFESAAEFRDAVLLGLEAAAGRSGAGSRSVDSSFSTRVIGPSGAIGELLPEDGQSLAALGRLPPPGGRTRLVLPPDLAGRVPEGLRPGNAPSAVLPSGRFARFSRPRPTLLVAVVFILVMATFAVLQATRGSSGEDPGEFPSRPPGAVLPSDTAGRETSPLGQAVTGSQATADSGTADPAAANAPVLAGTARVRVTPNDAVIRMVDQPDSTWRDGDELTVADGDTILLEFVRAGYVSERVPFTGSRVSVAMVPDSVTALFEANVRADIFLVTSRGEVRLGSTTSSRRMPSGTYTFIFRSPGQQDWRTDVSMRQAGRTYRVAKTDYATTGGLVAAVPGSWAMVSLDGGPEHETPYTWTDLTVGQHILRLTRQGFRTIVDTVTVPAGRVLRRQYELQSGGPAPQ